MAIQNKQKRSQSSDLNYMKKMCGEFSNHDIKTGPGKYRLAALHADFTDVVKRSG